MPPLELDASFWSRALSTLVGTVAGFAFSIVLFYLSERAKRSRERAKIVAGLMREAAFNINLCEVWLATFNDIRLKMAADDLEGFFNYIDYTRALRIFTQEAMRAGLLYDLLGDKDLVELDKFLRFLLPLNEQDINAKVAGLKGGGISLPDMSKALTFHEYVVKEGRKAMEKLRARASQA